MGWGCSSGLWIVGKPRGSLAGGGACGISYRKHFNILQLVLPKMVPPADTSPVHRAWVGG